MSEITKRSAEVAAKWWSDVIVNPKFDNGDNSLSSMVLFSRAVESVEKVTDVQKESFRLSLCGKIEEKLKDLGEVNLEVDYQPFGLLTKAAEEVGLSDSNFPWKTSMRVEDGFVSVEYGPDATAIVLYESKEYWEKRASLCELKIAKFKEDLLVCDDKEDSDLLTRLISARSRDLETYRNNCNRLVAGSDVI